MEITLYEIWEAVGEVQETLNNSGTTDLTEVEKLLGDIKESLGETNEYLSDVSDTLTDLNITANNTFDVLGNIFFLLCIGGIITVLVKTFFSGW